MCEALQARRVFARHPQPNSEAPRRHIRARIPAWMHPKPQSIRDARCTGIHPYVPSLASGLRTRVPPQAERVFAHLAEKSDSQGDIRKAVYLQDLQNRRVPCIPLSLFDLLRRIRNGIIAPHTTGAFLIDL